MTGVRPARPEDAPHWKRMRAALWPDCPDDEHEEEIERYLAGKPLRPPMMVFVAEQAAQIVGFAEASIRPYAEGCRTPRVAYLEGWYVVPEARRHGVGRALVQATERWGREQGCTELASDADPGNKVSFAAHLSIGFADAGLVRCFRKDL